MAKVGRPTDYCSKTADDICERLCEGESLRSICLPDDMPARSVVFRWLGKHQEFADQYARAREEQAESLADEIVYIADNCEDAAIGRLQVDARKWVSSKLKPKKYGDKITTEITGTLSLSDMTDDQLNIKLKALIDAGAIPE